MGVFRVCVGVRVRHRPPRRYKGVDYYKYAHMSTAKWRCRVHTHARDLHVGFFETEGEAAAAYDAAQYLVHGRYVCVQVCGLVSSLRP